MKNIFQHLKSNKDIRTDVIPRKGDARPPGAVPLRPTTVGLQHSALERFSDNPTLREARMHMAPRGAALQTKLKSLFKHGRTASAHLDEPAGMPSSERETKASSGSHGRSRTSLPDGSGHPSGPFANAESAASAGDRHLPSPGPKNFFDKARDHVATASDQMRLQASESAKGFALDQTEKVGGLLATQAVDATGRSIAASPMVRAAVGYWLPLPSVPEQHRRPPSKLNNEGYSLATRTQAHVVKKSAASFVRGANRAFDQNRSFDQTWQPRIDATLASVDSFLEPFASGSTEKPIEERTHLHPGTWVDDASPTPLDAQPTAPRSGLGGAWQRLAAKPAEKRQALQDRVDDAVFDSGMTAGSRALEVASSETANALKTRLPPAALNVFRHLPTLPTGSDVGAVLSYLGKGATGAMPGAFPDSDDDMPVEPPPAPATPVGDLSALKMPGGWVDEPEEDGTAPTASRAPPPLPTDSNAEGSVSLLGRLAKRAAGSMEPALKSAMPLSEA